MKKLLTLVALLAVCSPVFAADKYASVDIDKVLKGYKKTETINKTFQQRDADVRVFIVEAQKKVVAATTDEERKKLEDKYDKEVKAKMDKLQKDKISALQGIENDVRKAIEAEGKKGVYALILTSNNTLYGAIDISDNIIKTLNASSN